MNQYIITEEELLDTRSYIYHEDEVAFSRIESKVRSCPYQSERDNQQDTTYELCNFWKLHACKSMTTNNCWNKSCPDHDEYGSPCSFQSERDKVLEVISELERCIKPDDSLWAHYTPNEIVELLKTAVKAELRQAGEP